MRVDLDDGSWADVDELTYERFFSDPPSPELDRSAAERLIAHGSRISGATGLPYRWNPTRKPARRAPTRHSEPWEERRAEYLRRKES